MERGRQARKLYAQLLEEKRIEEERRREEERRKEEERRRYDYHFFSIFGIACCLFFYINYIFRILNKKRLC